MSLVFPRTDIITSVKYQDQSFKLQPRQELSRTAGGRTIGKDLGPGLWTVRYTTVSMLNELAVEFEAKMNSLDGVIQPFEAGDLRRTCPRSDPKGVTLANSVPKIQSVDINTKALALKDVPNGFVLSAGDYLSFNYNDGRALHQIMEMATANDFGVTPQFEVRPFIRDGFALDVAVTLISPKGLFTLKPDTLETRLNGPRHSSISFEAVQYL